MQESAGGGVHLAALGIDDARIPLPEGEGESLAAPHLGDVADTAGTPGLASALPDITTPPSTDADLAFNLINVGGVTPGSDAEAGFQRAAALWASFLIDPVTIRLNVGFSSLGPGILGSTGSSHRVVSYAAVRNALTADQTSGDDAKAVASLPAGSSLSFWTNNAAGTRVFDNDGSTNNVFLDVNTANLKALKITTDANGQPVDTGAADASITFSSDFTWDFDPSNGISPGAIDFVGVAFHEIGHALGFVSGVDDVDALSGFNLNGSAIFGTLDLFRYSASGVRELTFGGSPYFSIDGGTTNLALFSTGRFQGDGRQASHWKDNLGIGIMDPTSVPAGQANAVTFRDVQALDVIGWNLAAPRPDLIAANVSVSSPTASPGQHEVIAYQIKNAGFASTPSGFFAGTYLSSDPTVTTADTLLGFQFFDSLAAEASTSGTISVDLPSGLTIGATYYLGVIADSTSAVAEGSESNNVSSIAILILRTPHWLASVDIGSHPAGWLPASAGDFNHDSTNDVLWFNAASDNVDLWKIANGKWAGSADIGTHPDGWQPAASGDFNSDGTDDVLWYNPASGHVDIWKIANGQWAGSVDVGLHPPGWQPAGSGDFNADGAGDVLWYNPTSGNVDIWKLSNAQWAGSQSVGPHPLGWQPVGTGDFNGNGTSDVLWYNPTTRNVDLWKISNGQWAGSVDIGSHPAGWAPAGIGDFNADGTSDLAWFNTTTGDFEVWLIANGQWSASVDIGTHPLGWSPEGIGDFDHNGVSDVLWREASTNRVETWLLTAG